MHETKSHEWNSFVTLTYDDEHLPEDHSVDLRDFQLFAKRLRKIRKFRYYHCGEYGERYGRPHYHVCLFGIDFSKDRVPVEKTPRGDQLYQSDILDSVWKQGRARIGALTFESAAYVARYIMDKRTGAEALEHYEHINTVTGEISTLKPEYCSMSKKPGLGAGWVRKNIKDVYPSDQVIVRGHPTRPPKFYDGQYELENPEGFEKLKKSRKKKAAKIKPADQTHARLLQREACLKGRLKGLKKTL